jgi:dinuclear metal center YbgI/SA1388 family protein
MDTLPRVSDSSPRLRDVLAALDRLYDPRWAEPWDAVGLVCGDPDAPVRKILFAVDPVAAVAEEALEWGADLVVTHHPLLLRPVHAVAASTPKGRVVHRLIRGGCALYTAHTNADAANPGVSDALAAGLGLTVLRPLAPSPHDPEGRRGIGRVCELPQPASLGEFVRQVSRALPGTASGLRVSGDLDRAVRTVAVSGGAGDGFFEAALRARVDAYLTSDLRHHPASEFREYNGPALIDAPHWATEWPWLAQAAALLMGELSAHRATVETSVSQHVTDPWTDVAMTTGA